MKDSTALRVVELIVGAYLVTLHVLTGVDGFLLLICAFLFGVPIEIIYEKVKKRG